MDDGAGELQCVGRLEVAKPKPVVGFLCGTLPVLTDAPAFHSALLVPSPLTIGAPRYQMLPAETDLNTLPLLSGIPEKVIPAATGASEGLQWESNPVNQNLSTKCEALAVSGLAEYGDELDVVAPADIMKQIFKIPYSKAQLSIAVHRIGDTLILNTGPDVEEGDKVFRKQTNQSKGSDPSIFLNFAMHSVRAEACDCPPTHTSPAEKQSTSTILPGRSGNREGPIVTPACSRVGEAQFFDGTNNGNQNQGNHDKFFWGGKQSKHKSRRHNPVSKTSQVGEKPRCPVQESDKFRRVGNNGFLRVLFWKFHNFRMLLGSDLLLLSNEKYVAVSLHLWDVSRQVTPLTWLEAWLDNVMASVPELAVCYHQNGVVQGYELIKTDDIFLLKGISEDGIPAFHPQVVQQNGLSVLRFLQDNCKQDPGAYWLYKDAGDDVIQLFDLSVIPEGHSTDDHGKGCSSFQSLMHKGRGESLFSLGTLLYRVAHRLSLSKAPDNRAKCAKFFKKCLDFLREHDHLVVRAYAHEQFARLILKCYEELEITSESFLLESEVTVTDLEDESSEFSVGMFGSTVRDTEPFKTGEDKTATAGDSCIAKDMTVPAATETGYLVDSSSSYKAHDNLAMFPISSTAHPVVRTITDPISSRLAAIHHVSQAIKSLRWNCQLQNTKGDLLDSGLRSHERYGSSSFCGCGDADCIEVCDIREWLPKSKMDSKLWKLVLLLGESYLSLGEAYKDDGQLHQALTAVELACLIYGSMPQHLEDAHFISSMVGSSSYQWNLKDCQAKANLMVDSDEGLEINCSEEGFTQQFSATYLFWPKAWTLVGDVYVEYYRTRVKEIPVQAEQKTSGSGLHISNEVVREVKRLKRKLGQHMKNCSTCYLLNCSCQSDRASSGSSASSSSGDVPSYHSRKQNRKSNSRNMSLSLCCNAQDGNRLLRVENSSSSSSDNSKHDNDDYNNIRDMGTANKTYNRNKTSAAGNLVHTEKDDVVNSMDSKEVDASTSDGNDASKVPHGGIFVFLKGPRIHDAEYNMLAAIDCYNESRKAMDRLPIVSVDLYPLIRKKGWVCNELGRYRLENRNLASAEIAFADAIKAFKEVSDHTNIILIDCNLGHGRRALAEELVSKMDELKRHPFLQNAYEQAMKTAELEYLDSLRYYAAAKTELNSVVDEIDPLLRNEVYTQLAHTYLRLGMLLAREGISQEGFESGRSDSLLNEGKSKERRKHDISAGDAFREALSIYESLGELRKQEAAFSHFQFACYHRDFCLKFLDLDQKQVKHFKSDVNLHQKAKWYASLAEKHWQKSKDYYGPKTHSVMHLNILLELSALSLRLSSSLHSNTLLEVALHHLLEGRQVVVDNEGGIYDKDPEIQNKFLSQLRALLKSMLAASTTSGSPSKPGNIAQTVVSSRTCDNQKLREMYRMALKSTDLSQLPGMHKLWLS